MLALGGGCRVPIGAVGKTDGRLLSLRGVMYSLDGQNKIESTLKSTVDQAEALGSKMAESLVKQGAEKIMATWREKYGAW